MNKEILILVLCNLILSFLLAAIGFWAEVTINHENINLTNMPIAIPLIWGLFFVLIYLVIKRRIKSIPDSYDDNNVKWDRYTNLGMTGFIIRRSIFYLLLLLPLAIIFVFIFSGLSFEHFDYSYLSIAISYAVLMSSIEHYTVWKWHKSLQSQPTQ